MNDPDSDAGPVVVVCGPTGSGKSALAVDIALACDGVVINADAMQVYREIPILAARPGSTLEARVPHLLFGVLPASQACSVAAWLEMAAHAIARARLQGRLPVVVGGTGLYIKALIEGLAAIPDVPDAIRAEARTLHQTLGGLAFRERLASLDPEGAARLAPGDTQRLIRAYGVARASGQPLAHWQAAGNARAVEARFLVLALIPPREEVYAACDARFDAMLAAGALDEVRALLALGLDPALPAMKAVGVPELSRHLRGLLSLEEAATKARRATRNYAKRQLTWLRHQLRADHAWEGRHDQRSRLELLAIVHQFLLTGPT